MMNLPSQVKEAGSCINCYTVIIVVNMQAKLCQCCKKRKINSCVNKNKQVVIDVVGEGVYHFWSSKDINELTSFTGRWLACAFTRRFLSSVSNTTLCASSVGRCGSD